MRDFNLLKHIEMQLSSLIQVEKRKIEDLNGQIILVKYGGSIMKNIEQHKNIWANICLLKKLGALPVIVHGGGPAIDDLLKKVGKNSEFYDGHRVTDEETMAYVEMVLRGKNNGEIVKQINAFGFNAVGLSGKDGLLVVARKRDYEIKKNGKNIKIDLGSVGDVEKINPELVFLLLDHNFLPVVSSIACGEDFKDYNINADMFAGHLAGVLKAKYYLVVTDVDGIKINENGNIKIIDDVSCTELKNEIGNSINHGMIPKIESCLIALDYGVEYACIFNGAKENSILKILLSDDRIGTTIRK